jgi:hypothetical protein
MAIDMYLHDAVNIAATREWSGHHPAPLAALEEA